jgi:hypothetical protein
MILLEVYKKMQSCYSRKTQAQEIEMSKCHMFNKYELYVANKYILCFLGCYSTSNPKQNALKHAALHA